MQGGRGGLNVPDIADGDEPASVLAARALRAGLFRRHAGALMRFKAAQEQQGERVFNLHESGIPPTGLRPPELASFFQTYWPQVRDHTDTDRFRAESLVSALWGVRDVPGDLVECGSYRGGLAFLLAFAVREWRLPKRIHVYDSFEGLPALAAEDRAGSPDTFFYRGQFNIDDLPGRIRAFLADHDLDGIVELHRGWFDQTLPRIAGRQQFCFAHIDCDLYESARTCFTHLMAHLAPGAAVVVDDYDSHGMFQATWECLHDTRCAGIVDVGALKQGRFTIATAFGAEEIARPVPVGAEDWRPLLANRPYCAYLAGLCAEMIVVCSGPSQGPRDDRLKAELDRILGPGKALDVLETLIGFLYRNR